MSLAGSFITASINNLDNTSGCKIIFEYAEYDFLTFDYTIRAYTEGSPNPGVSIEKVLSSTDVSNNKVEWNLGVVTVVQDPTQRNQVSQVAAAMANYAEFPFKLTMQATVRSTSQNLFDTYEGDLSFKFTEASAPIVNDLYVDNISEANGAVSTTFGSGVHVMTKSILSVNRNLDYAPTYKNYATQSKIVYSVGAGTDIITSETTLLSGVKGYGNYVVTATAYDSRGFSSVMRKENVLVQKWEVPHFDAVCSAARNRSSGQSPNLLCTISGMFSPIFRNSSLVNEPHMYVKFGALSGDVITDYAVNQWHTVNFPSGSYGSSGTFTMNQTTLNTAFSSEPTKNPVAFINAYSDRDLYLDFTVYDRSDFPGSFPPQPSQQGDDYIRFHIPEATPVVSLRKKKIGINKNNPTEAVDIHGNAKVDGVLTISNDPNWTPSTTQINKVWKTDSNGVPGWRDENPGGATSVNNETGAVTGYDEQRGLVTESYIYSTPPPMKYITDWIPASEFFGTISITNTYYHKDLFFKNYSNTPSLIPYQITKTASFTLLPRMYVAINIDNGVTYYRIGIRQDSVATNHIVSMHIPNATDRYLRSSAALEAGAYYTYDESDLVT